MTLTDEAFVQHGFNTIEEARHQNLHLRLLGAIAFRIHCPQYANLHQQLGRRITDMDLVGYSKQAKQIDRFLLQRGYTKRPTSLSAAYSLREIYLEPEGQFVVDVFLDRLQMSHTIDFRGRLEQDYPTVPLADMFLQKMQIVELTEKDVHDTVILLLEHGVGASEKETVNVDHVARTLAGDWGFYHTATTNMLKMKTLFNGLAPLSDAEKATVKGKIDQLLGGIEAYPKSLAWRLRAKVGTSKRWYKEVERFEQ